MSAADSQALWARLKAAGVVTGDAPASGTAPAPWFVRVMLGVAGWIGALFLLFFVGLGLKFLVDSAVGAFLTGVIACVAAGMLFHAARGNDFATQFGLAVSLAGQALVMYALFDGRANLGQVSLGMCVFEAILFFAISNAVHRVWSAWACAYALMTALGNWHIGALAPGLLALACAAIWLSEFHAKHGALLRAGGYGIALALTFAVITAAVSAGTLRGFASRTFDRELSEYSWMVWIGAGLGSIALLWTVWRLLARESARSPAFLVAAGILALANLKAPGLAPAALILLLGYGNGNRVLFGLGVAGLLGYLSFYYYSLDATLLDKSVLMAATGAALLAARALLQRLWPAAQAQENRHA